MSDRFPPGKMSEYMSDKMSECLPEYMSVSRKSKLNKMFIYMSESLSNGMPNEMSLRMSDKIST